MATRTTSGGADATASISQLVISIKNDLTGLVHDEIALAKAEIRADAKAAALGGAFVAVAVMLALLALLILSFALVYGVHALGITLGWSFLIVGGSYLVLACLLGLLAKSRFGLIKGVPRAKVTAEEAVRALRVSQPRAPQAHQTGAPETPQTSAPQNPGTGAPHTPQTGAPHTPHTGVPRT